MKEGRFLDAQLGHECCGSRLVASLHGDFDNSAELFLKYHEQYSRWRDTGIRKAKQILIEDRSNVAILGLDIQEYYYRIRLDFKVVGDEIRQGKLEDSDGDDIRENSNLLRCIDRICHTYWKVIAPYLELTHAGRLLLSRNLPPRVGLFTSQRPTTNFLSNPGNYLYASARFVCLLSAQIRASGQQYRDTSAPDSSQSAELFRRKSRTERGLPGHEKSSILRMDR